MWCRTNKRLARVCPPSYTANQFLRGRRPFRKLKLETSVQQAAWHDAGSLLLSAAHDVTGRKHRLGEAAR